MGFRKNMIQASRDNSAAIIATLTRIKDLDRRLRELETRNEEQGK